MRENWNRATNVIRLTLAELTELIQPVFPGEKVLIAEYAEGGLANTNVCVRVSNQPEACVVRIFQRDPSQAAKECAIYRLIKPLRFSVHAVPCPRLHHFAETNNVTGHPYSIIEWVDGVRLETVVRKMSRENAIKLGETAGRALAAIHSFKFDKAGFFDANLSVSEEIDVGSKGLVAYAHSCLSNDVVIERIGSKLAGELIKFLSSEGQVLDSWTGAPCLTHSDFGGSNILVRSIQEYKRRVLIVTAVLDWEFAFAGTPFFDFGNLLRPPLGDNQLFQTSLVKGYTAAGGSLPNEWRQMSRITDLTAWLEFMTRPTAGPQLIADARRIIKDTIHHKRAAK